MYRVLMIAPTPFFADRGCHVRILGEVLALQAAGCEVTVCTYHHGRDVPGVRTIRIPPIPGYRKLTAGPSNAKYVADPMLAWQSLREGLGNPPDVIHGHLHEGAIIGRVLRRVLHVPLVFDYQGSLTDELASHGYLDPGGAKARIFGQLESWIDGGADAIVASSTRAAVALRRRYPDATIQTVLDGVDTDEFRPLDPARKTEVRRQYGIAPDDVLAVYVGVLADYQGIDLVLDHITTVLTANPHLRVLFAGYPEQEYRARAAALGLSDRVLFPGRVPFEETRALTAAADLGLTAKLSATEGNLKAYNYLACELPVVAFDNPVNREILGNLGVYAPQGDGAAFVQRIAEIAADSARREQLGRLGRQRAVERLSWHRAAKELIALYGRTLAEGELAGSRTKGGTGSHKPPGTIPRPDDHSMRGRLAAAGDRA